MYFRTKPQWPSGGVPSMKWWTLTLTGGGQDHQLSPCLLASRWTSASQPCQCSGGDSTPGITQPTARKDDYCFHRRCLKWAWTGNPALLWVIQVPLVKTLQVTGVYGRSWQWRNHYRPIPKFSITYWQSGASKKCEAQSLVERTFLAKQHVIVLAMWSPAACWMYILNQATCDSLSYHNNSQDFLYRNLSCTREFLKKKKPS